MKKISRAINSIAIAFLLYACGSGSGSNAGKEIELIPVSNGDTWGYINKKGEFKINTQFEYAGLFSDGIALVKTDGENSSYGYIDESGKYVINPSFLQATAFNNGVALVVSPNEVPKVINKKGEVLFSLSNAEKAMEPRGGFVGFAVQKDNEQIWGFTNLKGEIIINPQFKQVDYFNEGLCAVADKTGKWGFIDEQGKFVINPQFQLAEAFQNNEAIVLSDRKMGLIDKTGKYIINPQFEHLQRDGNVFVVKSGGKFGWADKDGKFIINPQFEATYGFAGKKIAAVMSGRSWGYVDKEGKYTINPQFSYASPFNGSIAVVGNGSQVGIVDKTGKYLVNPQFSGISREYAESLIGKNTTSLVVSDFVDIGSVINKIQGEITDNTIAGFGFSSRVGDIIQKYNKTPANYSYSNRNVYLFEREPISQGIKLSLEIGGMIFISRGWNYELNPESNPEQFQYRIDLDGRAISKSKDIMEGIKNSLIGYTLLSGDDTDIVMSNNFQKIVILDRGSAIFVEITKPN